MYHQANAVSFSRVLLYQSDYIDLFDELRRRAPETSSCVFQRCHNYMTEQLGLPVWGSYVIFGLATLFSGLALGLVSGNSGALNEMTLSVRVLKDVVLSTAAGLHR